MGGGQPAPKWIGDIVTFEILRGVLEQAKSVMLEHDEPPPRSKIGRNMFTLEMIRGGVKKEKV